MATTTTFKGVVHLTEAEYTSLVTNGSITKDGQTLTYDAGTLYVTDSTSQTITITTTSGSESISDGTNTLNVATTDTVQLISASKTFEDVVSFNDEIILANNKPIYAKNSGGGARAILSMSSDNALVLNQGLNTSSLIRSSSSIVPSVEYNNTLDLGGFGVTWKDIYLRGALRDGYNNNYGLKIPSTSGWNADKTIATTDQIPATTSSVTENSTAALTSGGAYTALSNKEDTSNKVTSLSSQSTDTQYPSAKCVYDAIDDVVEVAEGKTETYVVDDTVSANTVFNSQNTTITLTSAFTDVNKGSITLDKLAVGDVFYVTQTDVPDRWVQTIVESSGSYTVTLNKMETAKVPVTDVQVDGTSVVSSNAASVATINGNYNASSNKLATASDLPASITITTTSGSEAVSDGTNTLSFGANAFNSTSIPTSYVSSVNGNTGAVTGIATTSDIPTSVNGMSGGQLTSPLIIKGGDAATASKIALDPSTSGQITNASTQTIFGFTSNNATSLTVGHSSYALALRGSGTKPKFNGNDLALSSDVPSVSLTTTSGSQAITVDSSTLSFGSNAFNSTTIPTTTDLLNLIYPVGSIYMSVNSTSPATFLGGNWTQLENRFLLGAGSSYSNGTTGGSSTHQHNYGISLGAYYGAVGFEYSTTLGVFDYSGSTSYSRAGWSEDSNATFYRNNAAQSSSSSVSGTRYNSTGKTSSTSTLPPYLVVYMWKRVTD